MLSSWKAVLQRLQGLVSGPVQVALPPETRLLQLPLLGSAPFAVDAQDSLGLAAGHDFEAQETALCRALVHPGHRCLDVGANIGFYTRLLSRLSGEAGTVLAVEPDPENFRLLQHNCREGVADGSVRLIEAALGTEKTQARLYQAHDNGGMHRLYASVCCSDEWRSVSVLVGDELGLAPLDFIKIDIEGFEPAALRGLEQTLRASPCLRLMTEFSPLSLREAGFSPAAFIDYLAGLGLHCWGLLDGQWAPLPAAVLSASVSAVDRIDLQTLSAQVNGTDQAAIADAVAQALMTIGYTRPLLETLLWVRGEAEAEMAGHLRAAGLLAAHTV